jgi:sulfopyruvate decarboxylase subunit beta
VIPLREALVTLRSARAADDVVVTTMAPAREWMALGTGPRDLVLVPSSMGQATSFGLGIALAQPRRRVIVCNGDGSMLMNLGSLATIAAAAAPNLVTIVFDNGVYEVTGAQPTPGAAAGVDFAAAARACGIRSVFRFSSPDAWASGVAEVLAARGPTFVALDVPPVPGAAGPRSPGPAAERARRLREVLAEAVIPAKAGIPPA